MHALPEEVAGFISAGRVGHLGTADASGQPLVVPFCYAFDGAVLFSAVDAKPKRTVAEQLKRVRNIRENPNVCVVIDEWSGLSRLRHVIIQRGPGPDLRRRYRHGVIAPGQVRAVPAHGA